MTLANGTDGSFSCGTHYFPNRLPGYQSSPDSEFRKVNHAEFGYMRTADVTRLCDKAIGRAIPVVAWLATVAGAVVALVSLRTAARSGAASADRSARPSPGYPTGRRVEPELVARLSIFVHAFSHWSNTGFGISMPFAGLRTTSGSLVIRARSLSNFSTMTT
jgi:hypothetical protein